jgi:hypothetical protein
MNMEAVGRGHASVSANALGGFNSTPFRGRGPSLEVLRQRRILPGVSNAAFGSKIRSAAAWNSTGTDATPDPACARSGARMNSCSKRATLARTSSSSSPISAETSHR